MLIMLVAFLVAAFAILCIRVPSVWFALMATDEPSDARELSLVVASRASHLPPLHTLSTLHEVLTPAPLTPGYPTGNPFRESGPPACMAKLIMMRHKVRNLLPIARIPRAHLTYSRFAAVEPGQHAQTPHERDRTALCTTPVRIASTAPTGCPVDAHAQAFWAAAPLADLPDAWSSIP
ncbi:hypothetical protein H4582DRAFT_2051971 [Lactarius indigo]|nr:hypothetical protein H4582DRAFT_2051971 [Lactarius indigo]